MRKVEAFIFDLDGVITDTAEFHYLAWKTCATRLGIPFSREENEKLKGIGRKESLDIILRLGHLTNEYTETEKIKLTEQKNSHYKTLIKQLTPDDILPGIRPLIKVIKKHSMKMGLASASKNAFTVIESLGLLNDFDYIVDANKVSKGKPNPEVFLTAAEALKVKPGCCIGIEDAESGIKAIKSAGMFAVGIGHEEVLSQADLVFHETGDLDFNRIIDTAKKADS